MGAHASHDVHQHSIQAFAALDVGARESLILNCYLLAGVALTDRQVMERLGFADANYVRPRISTLIDRAMLMETGAVKDATTGRRVRTCEPTSLARKGGG